ncbi:nitrile hydratase subunit beta [Lentibacter algarum]|uniref:SH3-like domain-containing protein n=1 Tax=Lentibacter algarum TaxID=576131 RepID=UPI001C06BD89|nr:SH3-like domain-containing protein [Lentibacter algarum]MBU2982009.1 nitrile hydratase subunit beta [Lentibacter algarum]
MQNPGCQPKFHVGQQVMIKDDAALGHCRTPQYVRGAAGRITSSIGHFRNPEDLAYGGSGLPASPLYWVEIKLSDIWTSYSEDATDSLLVEVFEHWLTHSPTHSDKRN